MCHFAFCILHGDCPSWLHRSNTVAPQDLTVNIAASEDLCQLVPSHSLHISVVNAISSLAITAVTSSSSLAIVCSRSIDIAGSSQLQHPTGLPPLSSLQVHHCLVLHSSLFQFTSTSLLTASGGSFICAVAHQNTSTQMTGRGTGDRDGDWREGTRGRGGGGLGAGMGRLEERDRGRERERDFLDTVGSNIAIEELEARLPTLVVKSTCQCLQSPQVTEEGESRGGGEFCFWQAPTSQSQSNNLLALATACPQVAELELCTWERERGS